MKTVRFGVFETNSSSCHSLVICKEEDYEAWKAGKSALNVSDGTLVSMSEYLKRYEILHGDDYTEESENAISDLEEYAEVDVGIGLDRDGYLIVGEPKKINGYVAFIMERSC